jgi:hypothetical protein
MFILWFGLGFCGVFWKYSQRTKYYFFCGLHSIMETEYGDSFRVGAWMITAEQIKSKTYNFVHSFHIDTTSTSQYCAT